jgi:uncharacterized protein
MIKKWLLLLPVCFCFLLSAQTPTQKAINDSLIQTISMADSITALSDNSASKTNAILIANGPVGYVNDFEHILDSTQIKFIAAQLSGFEAKTTNEIGLVTISDFYVYGDNIKVFSEDLFNNWGLGKKDKNNGVLIVVSVNKRMVRITTGLGVTDKLTDALGDHIINDIMIPEFKQNNYGKGITNAVNEIIKILE